MVEGLEDDEEEAFFRANPDVVHVYLADMAETGDFDKLFGKNMIPDEDDANEAVSVKDMLWHEREFEAQMTKVTRVKEDQLETVFLGKDTVSRPIQISLSLQPDFRQELLSLLTEFQDVFAWDYTDMQRLDPEFYKHRILLKPDAVPVKLPRYRMNPNLARQVKEELDRLLRVGFIAPIKNPEWLSPIVVVPKKNKKIQIYVDYRKLNVATVPDPFPIPYMDSILDDVAGHEMYSFIDGFTVDIIKSGWLWRTNRKPHL